MACNPPSFRWRYLCTAIGLVAGSSLFVTTSRAADVWEDKTKEYLRNNYALTEIAKTPDLVLVYLCHPQGRGWWAYKLALGKKQEGRFELRAGANSPLIVRWGEFSGEGQGVYFVHDRWGLFQGPTASAQHGGAVSVTIAVGTPQAQNVLFSGRLSARLISDLSARCARRTAANDHERQEPACPFNYPKILYHDQPGCRCSPRPGQGHWFCVGGPRS